MLNHLSISDRYIVIRSWIYWSVGRLALIVAFVSALDHDLQIALASLAVAIWMIGSQQGLIATAMGKTVDAIAEKVGV